MDSLDSTMSKKTDETSVAEDKRDAQGDRTSVIADVSDGMESKNGIISHTKLTTENGRILCPVNSLSPETDNNLENVTDDINELIIDAEAKATKTRDEGQIEMKRNDLSPALQELASDNDDVYDGIRYAVYKSELQMPEIMRLITNDLSEPYSIYTYRYFIHNWPHLCFLAIDDDKFVGAIVCKHDLHRGMTKRGYIAMLAVDKDYRRRKIGSHLVKKAIDVMVAEDCDEVVLETEVCNKSALALYEQMGFVRDKRLFRYYLNGVDALRLKLWIK